MLKKSTTATEPTKEQNVFPPEILAVQTARESVFATQTQIDDNNLLLGELSDALTTQLAVTDLRGAVPAELAALHIKLQLCEIRKRRLLPALEEQLDTLLNRNLSARNALVKGAKAIADQRSEDEIKALYSRNETVDDLRKTSIRGHHSKFMWSADAIGFGDQGKSAIETARQILNRAEEIFGELAPEPAH